MLLKNRPLKRARIINEMFEVFETFYRCGWLTTCLREESEKKIRLCLEFSDDDGFGGLCQKMNFFRTYLYILDGVVTMPLAVPTKTCKMITTIKTTNKVFLQIK